MATDLYQAWSHRWGGVATLGWTDADGTYSVSTSASVAADRDFCHLDLSSVTPDKIDASAEDLGYDDFAGWLQTAMDASASTVTFTVAYSTANLTYTITPDSGTLALTFAGAAGTRMRRILGFTANKSAAAAQTSDMRPWYVNRAEVDGRTRYDQPAVRDGQIRSAMADDGSMYNLGPTSLVKQARWEHHFEAKASVHRHFAAADTLAGGASWTWEHALDHAARYAVPCVIKDSVESMVFRTSTPFARAVNRRRQADTDPQQIVVISADSIAGYL